MAAGLNVKIHIHKITYDDDDSVGGAMVTGTMSYGAIPARITARRPSQVSLEAGLETDRIFDMTIVGKGLSIDERDEIQLVWPLDHPFYNARFRITGIQFSGRRPQYGPRKFTLSRIERSRNQQ